MQTLFFTPRWILITCVFVWSFPILMTARPDECRAGVVRARMCVCACREVPRAGILTEVYDSWLNPLGNRVECHLHTGKWLFFLRVLEHSETVRYRILNGSQSNGEGTWCLICWSKVSTVIQWQRCWQQVKKKDGVHRQAGPLAPC